MNDLPYAVASRLGLGPSTPTTPQRGFRTLFISDVHLGTRGSKADMLARFLDETACEKLYLVGDIIDGWRLRLSW